MWRLMTQRSLWGALFIGFEISGQVCSNCAADEKCVCLTTSLIRPLKRYTMPLLCGWRGGRSQCSMACALQRTSNLCLPDGVRYLLVQRSVNWPPSSGSTLSVFKGAALNSRFRKSTPLSPL